LRKGLIPDKLNAMKTTLNYFLFLDIPEINHTGNAEFIRHVVKNQTGKLPRVE